jgi:hypothetical protein
MSKTRILGYRVVSLKKNILIEKGRPKPPFFFDASRLQKYDSDQASAFSITIFPL